MRRPGMTVSALENRIDTLAAALTASSEAGHAVPRELEKLLAGLIEKLEWVQLTHTDHAALAHLEDRIATLVKRFDASDARLGHLEAIERGLADLLVHIEQMRGINGRARPADRGSQPRPCDAIERDVAEIKQSERRTQDSLEAVQGTVEHVVDRLATIESDLHRDATARAAPAAQLPTRAPSAAPAPAPTPAQPASSARPTRAAAPAARRRQRAGSAEPARRESPLRGRRSIRTCRPIIRWNPAPQPAARARCHRPPTGSPRPKPRSALPSRPSFPISGRPNFIAAARRAAQAAAWARPGHQPNAEAAAEGRDAQPNKLSQRLRKLIVAGGAVLIVVGCLHIASRLFEDGGSGTAPQTQSEQRIAARRLDARSQSAGAGAARAGHPAAGAKPDARRTAERSTRRQRLQNPDGSPCCMTAPRSPSWPPVRRPATTCPRPLQCRCGRRPT